MAGFLVDGQAWYDFRLCNGHAGLRSAATGIGDCQARHGMIMKTANSMPTPLGGAS